MPRQKMFEDRVLKWFPAVGIVVSSAIGVVGWVSWITSNVPRMSYVDELSMKQMKYVDLKIAETIKYTDDKINSVRKESFDHSDLNKGMMETEYKGLSAKLDMLIMIVQQQNQNTRK